MFKSQNARLIQKEDPFLKKLLAKTRRKHTHSLIQPTENKKEKIQIPCQISITIITPQINLHNIVWWETL